MSTDVLLSVRDARVAYGGIIAVDRVDLEVHRGELVGLIGPNGAGKTTLLDVISGFAPVEAGTVAFDGHDITDLLPYQRARLGIARSFQDARLFPTLTVRQTLLAAHHQRYRSGLLDEGLSTRAARREERHWFAAAIQLLELVDLHRYLEHRIGELSTGTARAVELACLAATRPRLLLLDEPASGLQQSEVRVLGRLIDAVRGDAAVVVIDHDVPFVAGVAERLVALALGRVVADGRPEGVLADPVVLESYLGTASQGSAS